MSVTSGFFNSLSGDRKYDAIQISSMFDGLITDGIYNGFLESFMVTASDPASMVVTVGEGRCWFNHTWTLNDAPLPLTLDAGDVVLNRIDTVVIDVDSTDTVRACTIKVVKGTPSSQAVAPSLENTETHHQYPLCDISVVAGATTVTQSNITNRRGTSDCPFVATLMTTVTVDELLVQWESQWNDWMTDRADSMDSWTAEQQEAFTTWFQTVQDTLDEDTAGNLYNLITNNTGINATATHAEGVVAITATGNPVNIVFLAPSDWAEADTYTYNDTPVELVDLLGEPVEDAWVQGSPVSLTITGGKAFFKNGGGRYKPTDLPPLNPNFKMEITEGDTEDTVTVTADKLTISPTTDMLAGGQWEYGTEMSPAPGKGQNIKHWTRGQLVTSDKPFDGLLLGDVTASDAANETILWLPENQNGETVLVPFIVLSTDYLGGVYVVRKNIPANAQGSYSTKANNNYDGSDIDNYFSNTYLNSILDETVVNSLLTCTVPIMNQSSVSKRCWTLSSKELDSVSSELEGSFMPYFSNSEKRKASMDGASGTKAYWMRTPASTTASYIVNADGGFASHDFSYGPYGYRPAFVLPKGFQIQQRPDGSYTIYNEYGLLTLGDIQSSTSSKNTIINMVEDTKTDGKSITRFVYARTNYHQNEGALFVREKAFFACATSADYANSTINNYAEYYATGEIASSPIDKVLSSSVRQLVKETTFKWIYNNSGENTLTKKGFILSAADLSETYSAWTDEGVIPCFSTASKRICFLEPTNAPIVWWTRDSYSTNGVLVCATDGNVTTASLVPNNSAYGRLCFMLPLTAPIRLLADGTYDLVPEDPSLSAQTVSTLAEEQSGSFTEGVQLSDILPSTAAMETRVKIPESDGELHDYLYLSADYNGTGRGLVQRAHTLDTDVTYAHNVFDYANSAVKTTVENWGNTSLDASVSALIEAITIPYTSSGSYSATLKSLSARVFPLSGWDLGGNFYSSAATGTALPYYTSDARRQLTDDTGAQKAYWTRDGGTYHSSQYRFIYAAAQGTLAEIAGPTAGVSVAPAFTLPLDTWFGIDEEGNYVFVGTEPPDTDPVVSFSFTVPHGTQPVVRQYTYNYEEHYQTMLEGGVLPALGGDTGPTYSEVLSENTWAQIAQAVADKDPILDVWQVGDTKDEVIAGETLTFAIMGKNMDDLADGSGKAGLTFGMTQLMASTRQMNSSNTNAGSFAGSAMYSWLSGTIYPNLPTELKDAIKAVNKKTSSGGGSSAIRTDAMYLWLFAEIEVFGSTTYSYAGEGTRYPYFATASERIKRLSNGSGETSEWWERSLYGDYGGDFCNVSFSGAANYGYARHPKGVCFGFCI